ncbi:MAG: spore maturation protein [Bacillota bacterium]
MQALTAIGTYVFPALLLLVPVYAYLKRVPVYETFVEGAEEGLKMAVSVIPYIVAIFVGIACLRGSGALDYLSGALGFVLKPLGVPADIIPLIVVRPVSGSGALAVTGELLRTHGPDSSMGILASILQGATDTTFYVVTLYFGSVRIAKTRRALASCLIGDACGFIAGFLIWRALLR